MSLNKNQVIKFETASFKFKETIFKWLDEPHIKEFWDNSQEHRNDIIHFIEGRKTPSDYGIGNIVYWIGLIDDVPYCFLLTSQYEESQPDVSELHKQYLSKTGNTYSIDFCIGNTEYLGKKLASPTLEAFTQFFQKETDPQADTFLIDPDENNPRAIHVYEKAGFTPVGSFLVERGFFKGHHSFLMVKYLHDINAIIFQPLKASDLDLLYKWFQEPLVKQWYARDELFSEQDIKNKYLPRIQGLDNTPSFIISYNMRPIGFIQYYSLSEHFPEGVSANNALLQKYPATETAGIDLFIAESQFRSKGLGSTIINKFISHFLSKQFCAVVVDPGIDNKNAIRCYETSGVATTSYSEDKNHLILIKEL